MLKLSQGSPFDGHEKRFIFGDEQVSVKLQGLVFSAWERPPPTKWRRRAFLHEGNAHAMSALAAFHYYIEVGEAR